jgi:serine phosphatase RsbU (regulator of sigma subunit)
MTLTIRKKIIFITMAVLFLSLAINSTVVSIIYSHEYYLVLQTNSQILAQNLSFQLEKLTHLDLDLETIDGFDVQCEELVKKYRNITYAVVTNPRGTVVFSYFNNDTDGSIKRNYTVKNPSELSFINRNEVLARTVSIRNIYYNEVFIPIFDAKGNYIGATGVGFPLYLILNEIKPNVIISIMLSFILFILAIFFLLFTLNRSVIYPIKNLINIIEEIRAKKRLDKKVSVSSHDEIGILATAFNNMIYELDENRNALIEKKRIEKEMEIAKVIQTSILPKVNEVPGYILSTYMKPAQVVGGDYYDIIRDIDGNYWVNIGDVMGHGVTAGLIMMMLQTTFTTAVHTENKYGNSPDYIYNLCNKVIFSNVNTRLYLNQFITSCFFKCGRDGTIEYAGAHEHIIIYRSESSQIEVFPTQGIWLGLIEDITSVVKSGAFTLASNDILFLYTDGLIQMRNSNGEEYTIDRLIQFISKNGQLQPHAIHEKVLVEIENFCQTQEDDITFIIMKKE